VQQRRDTNGTNGTHGVGTGVTRIRPRCRESRGLRYGPEHSRLYGPVGGRDREAT